MLVRRPVRPARHPVGVNMAGGARREYIGVGEEVGVHIDELLVGVGDAHAFLLCQAAARLVRAQVGDTQTDRNH
jgi:hypothetical protein